MAQESDGKGDPASNPPPPLSPSAHASRPDDGSSPRAQGTQADPEAREPQLPLQEPQLDEQRPADLLQRIGAAPPPAPLPTSIGLDTNTRWTLRFMAFVAVVSVGAWGAAKVACNYHPPQSQKFKVASFETLTSRPQDAALEFHHSLFVQDYERATRIALEEGVDIVEEARARCDAACAGERQVRSAEANTRATLFTMRAREAWAKAETFYRGQVVEDSYWLRREGQGWVVVGRGTPPPIGK